MTETAEKLTDVDGEAGTAQYNLLVGALASLSRGDHARGTDPGLLPARAGAVATGGWAPSFTDCARCGRPGRTRPSPRHWAAWCAHGRRPPGSPAPAPETVLLLGALLTGDWPTADASRPVHRREAAGLVASYPAMASGACPEIPQTCGANVNVAWEEAWERSSRKARRTSPGPRQRAAPVVAPSAPVRARCRPRFPRSWSRGMWRS